ncbi:MAG: hypothetical protein IKH65_05235 [Clostridia bacterium]|nr:hypothetical protein [Clostridia bacterium]
MKQRIINYKKRIDTYLSGEVEIDDWQKVMDEHMVQIAFFQHERLIHLMVTLTFAIMTIATGLVLIVTAYMPLTILLFLFLVLLIPYIKHYFLLENETQKMYVQYDEILKRLGKNNP